jgi:Asp-tRNA(Asn)/Glu-tRNA(Gln) amidotransferase A subunit family amidase
MQRATAAAAGTRPSSFTIPPMRIALVRTCAFALLVSSLHAKTFDLSTATVADINEAFDAGALSSEKLVGLYLQRIEAYDKQGPKVNCVITLNPQALDEARALDAERKAKGARSPLHGIPIVLKDLIDVAGLPTTAGFTPFGAPVPLRDSTIVSRMHAAGALILAKVSTTNWFGVGFKDTHPIGESLNPYNLTLSPGGSSNGPGVALACYFATLGVGTDTSVSVQSPSSNCSIVGMVGTYGMVSRAGIVPRGATQDRAGPMGRSVYDVLTLFSVISGWDAEDLTTFHPMGHFPQGDWAQELKAATLKGKRLGVLREMIPTGEPFAEGAAIFERALDDLRKAGAYIVDPIMTGSPNIAADTGQGRGRTAEYEKFAFTNAYLARLGTAAKYKTVEEMIEKVGREKFGNSMLAAASLPAPDESADYLARYKAREMHIALIAGLQERYALDGFVQPFTIAPAPGLEGSRPERDGASRAGSYGDRPGVNNLTSTLGLPAVVVPGGYTPSKNFPIAIQFFGKPFTDLQVAQLAHSYEQVSKRRKTPETTPPLPGEVFDYRSPSEKNAVAAARE